MKVILPAADIPLGSLVTKVREEKQYVLLDKVRIFVADGVPQEIKAEGGARFLSNSVGDFNAVNSDVELVWVVDASTLYEWLSNEGDDE